MGCSPGCGGVTKLLNTAEPLSVQAGMSGVLKEAILKCQVGLRKILFIVLLY